MLKEEKANPRYLVVRREQIAVLTTKLSKFVLDEGDLFLKLLDWCNGLLLNEEGPPPVRETAPEGGWEPYWLPGDAGRKYPAAVGAGGGYELIVAGLGTDVNQFVTFGWYDRVLK